MLELDLLVRRAKELEQKTVELEEQLKASKQEHKRVLEQEIPQAMMLDNIAEYKNLEGVFVTFKQDYRGSAAQDRADEIIKFLGRHGEAGGYRKYLTVAIPYDPDGQLDPSYNTVVEFLDNENILYEDSSKIHHRTLEATLGRLMPILSPEDTQIAKDILKATEYYKTKIKG